jgi:TolB protein
MKQISLLRLFVSVAACALFALAPYTPAKATPHMVHIVGAGESMVNIVQATPMGSTQRAAALQRGISNNMAILPFVNEIAAHGIPGGAAVTSGQPSAEELRRFTMAQVHMLITANWISGSQVELRCFEVTGGRFMFGNRYTVGGTENDLLDVADKFCADFLDAVIGNGSFFRSTLAFVKSDGQHKKDIWSVRSNGRHLTRLTNMPGEALSPAWSPDGRRVLFTHIDRRSHGLGIFDLDTRTVNRIRFPGNTVIGPAFMPNGTVAVGMTDGRNPSIFLLSQSFAKQGILERSGGIDVSPSIDSSGSLMAFTSSRLGGPQIFMKDVSSGLVTRVSREGSYNTEPNLSRDGALIVYTRLTEAGQRIFVQDLRSGAERQISFGPGSDEQPSFAPDSYFIAFTSSRGGARQLYLTTRHGGEPSHLRAGGGDVSFPRWGMVK